MGQDFRLIYSDLIRIPISFHKVVANLPGSTQPYKKKKKKTDKIKPRNNYTNDTGLPYKNSSRKCSLSFSNSNYNFLCISI